MEVENREKVVGGEWIPLTPAKLSSDQKKKGILGRRDGLLREATNSVDFLPDSPTSDEAAYPFYLLRSSFKKPLTSPPKQEKISIPSSSALPTQKIKKLKSVLLNNVTPVKMKKKRAKSGTTFRPKVVVDIETLKKSPPFTPPMNVNRFSDNLSGIRARSSCRRGLYFNSESVIERKEPQKSGEFDSESGKQKIGEESSSPIIFLPLCESRKSEVTNESVLGLYHRRTLCVNRYPMKRQNMGSMLESWKTKKIRKRMATKLNSKLSGLSKDKEDGAQEKDTSILEHCQVLVVRDQTTNEEKQLEKDRELFRERAISLISCMHTIQGDRGFSCWKGSVLDSLVGAFLTQNATDKQSSSAFMSLIAKYPKEEVKNVVPGNSEPSSTVQANNRMHFSCGSTSAANQHPTKKRGISKRLAEAKKWLKDGMNFRKNKQKEKSKVNWEELRRSCLSNVGAQERNNRNVDALDWNAVRCAQVEEIAQIIHGRGMNNRIAERIKNCLNRIQREHGSLDLEWLRHSPPEKAKEFLLSIYGIGLKSVECLRLLTLKHLAFPVDTNVGRIVVRLGWVPMQPLQEGVLIHDLKRYPKVDTIQEYLWPRLTLLDERELYELHCQLITFGKVICTKREPNCNACPMRGECKHFASSFASSRLSLPKSPEKGIVISTPPVAAEINFPESRQHENEYLPIAVIPPSAEWKCEGILEQDIEDLYKAPPVSISNEKFRTSLWNYLEENNVPLEKDGISKALIAVTAEDSYVPVPKLKNVGRLRTEHQVYVLPDSHSLLQGFDKQESDDPYPYILAIWPSGETENSNECCSSQQSQEDNTQTVPGTILIPCRTANRGIFPLNGTYFQNNEVFADDASSQCPINVPWTLIRNLPRKTLYCGTSITDIFRGLPTQKIQQCFWKGFVCTRGFNRKTRVPKRLAERFHRALSMVKN